MSISHLLLWFGYKVSLQKGSRVVSWFPASGSIERWLDHEANGLINGLIHWLINSRVDYPEVSIVSGCRWISHWDVDTDQDVYTDMDKRTIKYNQVSWKYYWLGNLSVHMFTEVIHRSYRQSLECWGAGWTDRLAICEAQHTSPWHSHHWLPFRTQNTLALFQT